MISIIITTYKEPRTIGRAIESLAQQVPSSCEILVTAPDIETLTEAKKYKKKYFFVKLVKDAGKGKPAAMNLAISKSRGDILVFTDGDVYVGENSISLLLEKFKHKEVGAVSGNPTSISPKDNRYGFWSYLLTKVAHQIRKKALKSNKRIFCSGYLFAIKKKLIPRLPEELLSEDGYISHFVYEGGYKIEYAEHAKVYVKYTSNFRDWIKQKRRSVGGYNQNKKLLGVEIRSFKQESLGFMEFFPYIYNIKEFAWLIELFLARIYLWFLIYRDINFRKKKREELWLRVDSTK